MIEKTPFNKAIEDYFAAKFMSHIAKECVFNQYIGRHYNWFERMFCKNIIEDIKKLNKRMSKTIKWERFTDEKGEKNETLFYKPNNRSTPST